MQTHLKELCIKHLFLLLNRGNPNIYKISKSWCCLHISSLLYCEALSFQILFMETFQVFYETKNFWLQIDMPTITKQQWSATNISFIVNNLKIEHLYEYKNLNEFLDFHYLYVWILRSFTTSLMTASQWKNQWTVLIDLKMLFYQKKPSLLICQINNKLYWKLWWLKQILTFYIKNNYLEI